MKFFNKRDIAVSLILAGIGAVAGFALVNLQWTQLDDAAKSALLGQLGSKEIAVLVSTIQTAILTLVATFLGVKLARNTYLELRWIPARQSRIAIGIVALSAALVIAMGDRLFFAPFLPESALEYQFSLLYLVSSVLYGGIIEEVLLRLFVLSLIVFVTKKLFLRRADTNDSGAAVSIPSGVYIAAIVISAALFAAGHLPATAQLLGLSTPIIIRAFVLNGFAGVGFGYLYWKYGLGSAISAHILTHLLIQLVIMPIVA